MSELVKRLRIAHTYSGNTIFLEAAQALEAAESTKKLYEFELTERMNICATTLRTTTNGEWDKLKELHPELHAFIKQAINRGEQHKEAGLMKQYVFKLLIDGQLVGEGYGQGDSAMEAFENGVETGSVYFPDNQEIEVLAMSNRGLGIRFKAVKSL